MYLILLLVVCLLLYTSRHALNIRRSRLYEVVFRYPACLKELPVVGSLYHFHVKSSEDTIKKIMEAGYNTMKDGGIARIYGFNTYYLVLTDPADVSEVLTRCLDKDYNVYRFLQVVTGNGSVFVPDPSISKVRRRFLMPIFSSRMWSNYIESINEASAELTEVLEPYVGKGPFIAGPHLGAFCFNSLIRLGDLQEIRKEICTSKLLDDFHKTFKLVNDRSLTFWMYPDFVYKYTSNCAETRKYCTLFYDYAMRAQEILKNKVLSSCTSSPKSPDEKNILKSSILDGLLHSELTQEEIAEEMLVMMGASEDSGVLIGYVLKLFGLYPAVQDKAYEELAVIFGDSDRPLEDDDISRMPYLDMVIKEVFRVFPPVPLILRTAHKEIKLASGRVVPAGAGIAVPIISIHRNPRCWGPDAEHFDPERFLPERLAAVPENAHIPFSYGPRGCPGYKLGSYLVKLALCAILRKYKVVGTPAAGPVPCGIRTKFEVTLRPVDNFEIELVNRM